MIRFFFDMDGTASRFHDEVQYLERMFEKDFFRNLKPFQEACDAINKLAASGICEVYVLSACVDGEPPYCREEKNAWLDRYLPNVPRENRIFTKVGIPKSEYIPGGISKTDILLDDYTKNLLEWESDGGTGIKAKNNTNCKGLYGEKWLGRIVDICADAEDISRNLEAIINAAEEALEDAEEWEI